MAVTVEDLERIVNPLFKNLSDKIDHISEMSSKDIKTLFKQSTEHYKESEKLDEKIQQEIEKVKKESEESIQRIGERVGLVEQSHVEHKTLLNAMDKHIDESKESKRFSISQAIVIGAVALDIGYRIFTGG